MDIHEERNKHYLRLTLPVKEKDQRSYSINIKKIKEINKEVFDSAFLYLTRNIDDFGLEDLIRVLEVLSETRYYDQEKMPLVESIAERIILVLLKINDEGSKKQLLERVKDNCEKLDLIGLYEG